MPSSLAFFHVFGLNTNRTNENLTAGAEICEERHTVHVTAGQLEICGSVDRTDVRKTGLDLDPDDRSKATACLW